MKFKYITEHKGHEPERRCRFVMIPTLDLMPKISFTPDGRALFLAWESKWGWTRDFNVDIDQVEYASGLARQMVALHKKNPQDPEIERIITSLKSLALKDIHQMSYAERWEHEGINMFPYVGNQARLLAIMSKLSDRSGRVLELMSGHQSYFESSNRRNIVAVDLSLNSLLRFTHPSARRIWFDLDQISHVGDDFPFFRPLYFDAVSICFGYKYILHIDAVFRAIRRVLKPTGVFSLVECATSEFSSLKRRKFVIDMLIDQLRRAGFTNITYQIVFPVPLQHMEEDRNTYIIEAMS